MTGSISIDGANGCAGGIAQAQKLIVDPGIISGEVPTNSTGLAAPASFECRCRLSFESGRDEGVGGQRRVRRCRASGAAVRGAIDGRQQVVMRRGFEAAADGGKEDVIGGRFESHTETGTPGRVAAIIAGIGRSDGAVRQAYRRVHRIVGDRRTRCRRIGIVIAPRGMRV
ncbi:hypothetical protein D3C80_929230 [compost metagenome]